MIHISRSELRKLKLGKARLVSARTKPTVKQLDELCRDIVRARDHFACRRCGRRRADGWKIDWAHFIGRKNKAVRWDIDNSCMLCFNCHFNFMHGHDGVLHDKSADDLWASLIGKRALAALKMRASVKGKVDLSLIKIYLEHQKKQLKSTKGIDQEK